MQDKLYDMLLKEDEITWQTILMDLIKTEEMDPWDINIGLLTKRYIETVNQLKTMNFFISGKVVLAAALMLKIKSNKLVNEDIANLDYLLYPPEDEDLEGLYHSSYKAKQDIDIPPLAIKSPQSRKRNVNINDLMNALKKALEVNHRRVMRHRAERNFRGPDIPVKKIDINQLIKDLYEKIKSYFVKEERLTFDQLVSSDTKEGKILTLLPLLHLDTQEKINLIQEEHFGEIEIAKT